MKSLLLILLVTVSFKITTAQSPGGIAINNTMWLKADVGLSINGSGDVTQWQEVSGANVTGNFTTQPVGPLPAQTNPTVLTAGINFNPYVSFNGSNNSLLSLNSIPGTSLVSNSNVTVFQVLNLKSGSVWLDWETDGVGATGRMAFQNWNGGKLRFDFPKAVPLTAGMNVGVANVLNKHSLSTCYAEPTISTIRLNGVTDNTIPIPGPGNFANLTRKVIIGNDLYYNLPTRIDIAELIIYSRTLTAAERNKVESYLAIKYGFTLDQAAANGNDYTSSNGTIAWDRAANSAYANNITGIGRDDASGLSQKQSKSINTTALVTLYNGNTGGSFPALNADNTSAFSSDGSFLIIGDNAGSTAFGGCLAGNHIVRIGRIWKAQKTGTGVADVTIAANATDLPAEVKTLIVSQDPTFATGVSIYPLTNSSGTLYKALTLNNNDYFTFGGDSLLVNLTTTPSSCTNQNGGQITTTVTGSVQPYTYSWAPGGLATPGLANIPDGTYTLTVTHGGCQYTQAATIVLNNDLALSTNSNSQVCTGGSQNVTTTSNATSYSWTPATGVSDPSIASPVLTPTSTTSYTVTGTLGTCTTSQSFTVTVVPAVTPNAGPDLSINAGQSVPLQGSGPAGTYLWTPATGLSAADILTPVASPVITTTYTLTITTPGGCVGSDDVTVKVNTSTECKDPMNALTPNGDGINDRWIVFSSSCVSSAKVQVFNRYGSKVYESQNYQNDWQGTYHEKALPDGTYFFVVELKPNNGRTKTIRGNVTILR